jgi:hypothetical protein
MRTTPGCFGKKRGGFNDALLDQLYTRMEEFGREKEEKERKAAEDQQLLQAAAIEANYAGAAAVFASRDRVQSVVYVIGGFLFFSPLLFFLYFSIFFDAVLSVALIAALRCV